MAGWSPAVTAAVLALGLRSAEEEINTGSAKRLLFSQWLNSSGVNALTATSPPRIDLTEPRNNVDRPVASGSEEWLTRYNDPGSPTAVLHYTFNTPWATTSANQCGRVLFSDFHVSIGNTGTATFRNHCTGSLTNQEKVLAFFLFDLTSCIQTAPPATCTPRTCASYPSGTCGVQSDGCGGTTADCGTCPNGQTCGGGGVQNQCGGFDVHEEDVRGLRCELRNRPPTVAAAP